MMRARGRDARAPLQAADRCRRSEELRHGDYVAVVGVLDIDAPTPSAPRPRAFVVVVESIETLDQRAF